MKLPKHEEIPRGFLIQALSLFHVEKLQNRGFWSEIKCITRLLQHSTNYIFNCVQGSWVFTAQNELSFKLGLGRAKARPEIWPTGHGFWVARPDPGQILGGPTHQPEP